MNKDTIKEVRKNFEANLLDGDLVEDCGKAMLSATEVWDWLKPKLQETFDAGRKEGVENTIKEVKALIRLSKTEWQAMDDLLRDLSH